MRLDKAKIQQKIQAIRSKLDLERMGQITKVGSWYLDLESNEVTWTKELYDMYGFDPSKPPPPYTEHMKLFTPDSWDLLSKSLDQTAKEGIPYELELRTIRKDKKNGWMWVRGEAIKNEDGKIVGLWGAAQDITRRVEREKEIDFAKNKIAQKEVELNSKNKEFEAWIQNTAVCTKKLDLDFNLQFMSSAGIKELKVEDVNELYGRPYPFYFFPDSSKEIMLSKLEKVKKTKKGFVFDGQISDTKGNLLWYNHSIVPVLKEDSNLDYILVISNDITERKEAEFETSRAKQNAELISNRLESALESMSDAVYISNIEGEFVSFNKAFATFHKFKNKEDCAKTLIEYPAFLDVFYPDGKLLPLKMWVVSRALRGESGINEEYHLRRKDTGESWIASYNYAPILSDSGAIIGSVVTARDITDQKRNEHELIWAKEKAELNEKQLGQSQELAKLGGWELDIESQTFSFTESFYKLLHTSSEEMNGFQMSLQEYAKRFVYPDDSKMVADETKKAIETDDPNFSSYVEHRILYADGGVGHVGVKYFVTKDKSGNTIKTYGVNQDITERKENENKLLETQHLLTKAQEIGLLGTWTLDLKRNVLSWTDQNYRIFGIAPGTPLTYEDFIQVVHPDDRTYVNEEWTKRVRTNNYDIEHRLLIKDQVKWVREKAEITFDDSGEPIFAIGFTQDITKQKIVQKENQELLARFKKIAKHVPGFIYQYQLNRDKTSFFPYASDGILDIYGVSPEQAMSNAQCVFDVIHPDDLEGVSRSIFESADNLTVWHDTYRVNLPNRMIWVEGKSTPTKQEDGSVLWHGYIRDITDLKEYEFDLIKAKERAEESDRLKSTFLANMSHEIRTPLNGIMGFSELLLDPETKQEDREKYAAIIDHNGERLLALMKNIVDISKIEANQIHVSKSILDIGAVFESLKLQYLEKARDKGLELKFEMDSSVSEIYSDQNLLEGILINFINNAFKYTESGYISVNSNTENNNIVFKVRDTGLGISKGKIDTVFDRYKKEDNHLTKKYEGAGLGLSICKSYAELLNGKVWVESELGKGSSFYFSFPIER
jgi:PAS domain S-box-containing protein